MSQEHISRAEMPKEVREHMDNCIECSGQTRCVTYWRLLLAAVKKEREQRERPQ